MAYPINLGLTLFESNVLVDHIELNLRYISKTRLDIAGHQSRQALRRILTKLKDEIEEASNLGPID